MSSLLKISSGVAPFSQEAHESCHKTLSEAPWNTQVKDLAGVVWTKDYSGIWGSPEEPQRLNSLALVSRLNPLYVEGKSKKGAPAPGGNSSLFDL